MFKTTTIKKLLKTIWKNCQEKIFQNILYPLQNDSSLTANNLPQVWLTGKVLSYLQKPRREELSLASLRREFLSHLLTTHTCERGRTRRKFSLEDSGVPQVPPRGGWSRGRGGSDGSGRPLGRCLPRESWGSGLECSGGSGEHAVWAPLPGATLASPNVPWVHGGAWWLRARLALL